LILQLLSLTDCLQAAELKRAPNMLCEYAFELAQNFSRFYGEHHVLSEPDSGLRASRLGLCALVLAVLTGVLGLLGIEVPERM
jgi:arginyl-tRNA synthetase